MSTASARLFIALTLACSLGGCRQGLGDHCQIEDDCEEALTCVLPNNNVRVGGTCQMPPTDTTADMAAPAMVDMAQGDLSSADAASPVDG